ncbi:MAG: glycosyltransferase [Phycisphaerales bacterium]
MRIVHLAITPIAGAPIRICRALRDQAQVNARLVVRDAAPYGNRTFPNDLVWQFDRSEARRLIDEADLLVCHNQVGPEGRYFADDLDLAALSEGGKPMLRLLHSPPEFLAATGPWRDEDEVMTDRSIPTAVIAQGQERFYPWAVPLRTPIGIDPPPEQPRRDDSAFRIVFSPTSDTSASVDRWSSKGRDETVDILESIRHRFGEVGREIVVDLLVDAPFEESIRRRRFADVVIDEVVTGNFHLSSLESMRLGVPVIGRLDEHLRGWLQNRTGDSSLPWLDATLDDLEAVLTRYIEQSDVLRSRGAAGRAWVDAHWSDAGAVADHRRAYEALLRGDWITSPRFDLSQYADWWDRYGRVEATRWKQRVEIAAKPTRREITLLYDLIREFASGSDEHATAIMDRPVMFQRLSLAAESPRLRFVDIGGQRSPESIPSSNTIILADSIEHRPPSQARSLFNHAFASARRKLVVAAPSSEVDRGHHRLDSGGGFWKHDWLGWAPSSRNASVERGPWTVVVFEKEWHAA